RSDRYIIPRHEYYTLRIFFVNRTGNLQEGNNIFLWNSTFRRDPVLSKRRCAWMIRVGTAGYSYTDWIGPFYPAGIKKAEMLEFYSQHFSFVEINTTYYHMPGMRLFQGLDRKTPPDFLFAVKLFGGFTHERNCGKEDAERFIYALSP